MPRRRSSTRSGLPTACGVKFPDGRECRNPAFECEDHDDPASRPRIPSQLSPAWFRDFYKEWLTEQGRDEQIPADTLRFVHWWSAEMGEDTRTPQVPWTMDVHLVEAWWLTWCRETGRERLIPFDLRLYFEWWKAT